MPTHSEVGVDMTSASPSPIAVKIASRTPVGKLDGSISLRRRKTFGSELDGDPYAERFPFGCSRTKILSVTLNVNDLPASDSVTWVVLGPGTAPQAGEDRSQVFPQLSERSVAAIKARSACVGLLDML